MHTRVPVLICVVGLLTRDTFGSAIHNVMVQESNSVPILGKREPSLAQKKLDRTRAILAVLMM